MKKQEIFIKNSILAEEFTRYMVENPDFAARIPKKANLVLLPQDDPELCAFNKGIAKKVKKEGHKVILVRINKLIPSKSRIVRPEIINNTN